VACGVVVVGHGFGFAAEVQQQQASHNADQHNAGHIQRPEIACEVTHFKFSFYSLIRL
jgi:DNA-binding winged helix-turn-helix (wHTH) protein